MLVATFGPTTGWAGRTITFYDGRFTLEGHGFITAGDVLEYDRRGHLTWAYDGLRDWAYSLTPPPRPAPVAPPAQEIAPVSPQQAQTAAAAPAQTETAPPAQAPLPVRPATPAAAAEQTAPAAPAEAPEPTDGLAGPVAVAAAQTDEATQATETPAVQAPAAAHAPPPGPTPAAVEAPPEQAPAAAMTPLTAQGPAVEQAPPAAAPVQDVWRAHCLDFDARVLAALATAGEVRDDVLTRAARCIRWDFGADPQTGEVRGALTLYDRWGAELRTFWVDADVFLPESGTVVPAAAAPGWQLLDAPWASMCAPPGFVGGEPETAGPAAAAALQARGPDWAAWAGEWFTPMTAMYQSSRGQLAPLLFAVDTGAPSLAEAAYAVLVRQELDAAHRDVTLQWRTDDLVRRMSAHGSAVESVVYGTLGGWRASRIVAESAAGFRQGPRRVHVAQYVFMDAPYTYSLDFTLPSAASQRLGEADRCAATFVFKG